MTTNNKIIDEELTKPLVEKEVDVEEQPIKKKKVVKVVLVQEPCQGFKGATSKQQRGGCPCWCKCIMITMGILFLLGAVATMVVYSAMSDVVQHLTVTTPHDKYPIVEMTDRELNVVKDRVELFVDQLLAGDDKAPKDPLVITQDEINGFIGHSDYLKGNMYVTIKEGGIIEEYSLPTSMLPGGKDRYFVAHDYLKLDGDQIEMKMETAATHHDWFDGPLFFAQLQYLVSDQTDLLELYLTKGSIFGQVAPQDWIDQRQNLLKDLYEDPDAEDARVIIEGIDRVRIENGKIIIEPKAAEAHN